MGIQQMGANLIPCVIDFVSARNSFGAIMSDVIFVFGYRGYVAFPRSAGSKHHRAV
jgi:hypothetical protein